MNDLDMILRVAAELAASRSERAGIAPYDTEPTTPETCLPEAIDFVVMATVLLEEMAERREAMARTMSINK